MLSERPSHQGLRDHSWEMSNWSFYPGDSISENFSIISTLLRKSQIIWRGISVKLPALGTLHIPLWGGGTSPWSSGTSPCGGGASSWGGTWHFIMRWWYFIMRWWYFNMRWWYFIMRWWYFIMRWWYFTRWWYIATSSWGDDTSTSPWLLNHHFLRGGGGIRTLWWR